MVSTYQLWADDFWEIWKALVMEYLLDVFLPSDNLSDLNFKIFLSSSYSSGSLILMPLMLTV